MSSKKSRTVDLGGGDYSPFENNSYICVINHPFTDADETSADCQTSYGGNQNWFEDDNGHWFPQDVNGYVNYNFDAYIDPHGCGLIAYNDVSLFLLNGYSCYDYEDYYDIIHTALISLLDGDVPIAGVFYGSICNRLESIGHNCGYSYNATWRTLDVNDSDALIDSIEDMLSRNYPVIMSLHSITEDEDRFHYYSLQDEAISDIEFANSGYFFIQKRNAQGHYFTVTGIIYDYQAEEVYLRVSNAGREQYIIFSEYVSYVENHGVVFSSTVNPGNAIIYFEE